MVFEVPANDRFARKKNMSGTQGLNHERHLDAGIGKS